MYHSKFIDRRNYKGKRYRDEQGSLIQYCLHMWLIYPVFEKVENYHAGFIPESGEKFLKFEGICKECGEHIAIFKDGVVANNEEYEKCINEILKEKSE